jgi:alginate O-acetyltransferase complex protein AlgJ
MKKVQVTLVAVFFLVLSLPLASYLVLKIRPGLKVLIDVPLSGVVIPRERPVFSLDSFERRAYQDSFNNWYARNFVLRPLFIKLNNQLFYTLFDKSYMAGQSIIIGKEHQLYSKTYISDLCNFALRQPVAEDEKFVRQVAELQDLLRQRGIILLFLVSPNKATVYPEFIPDEIISHKNGTTRAYDDFIGLFKKYNIQYIDGHDILVNARKQTRVPLFCQGGLHWNSLGAFYVADATIKKMEELRGEPFNHIYCKNIRLDYKPAGSDKDLADLLNLIVPPTSYLTPHPEITSSQNARTYKISVIGTSFNWVFLDILHQGKVFDEIDFFYYYSHGRARYPLNQPCTKDMRDIKDPDIVKDFLSKDVIIIEMNEINFQISTKNAEDAYHAIDSKEHYARKFIDDALRQLKARERE